MTPSTKCAHPSCKCEVTKERLDQHARHCSDWCAVEATEGGACGCGHAACDLHVLEHPTEHESVIGLGPEGSGNVS